MPTMLKRSMSTGCGDAMQKCRLRAVLRLEEMSILDDEWVDKAAKPVDYVCGAATAYQIIHEDALVRHLSTVAALVVSVRGYSGIRQILEQGHHVPD